MGMHTILHVFRLADEQTNEWTQQNLDFTYWSAANSPNLFKLGGVGSSQHGCATLDLV